MQDEKNVRPDFAKLPENSAFYQPEDRRSTRDKLKDMDFRQKLSFIAEYYGINILVTLAIVGAVLFLILHFAFGKSIGFSIMAVNTTLEQSPADDADFFTDFLVKNGVDLKKQEVSIDSGLGVSATGEDSASQTNLRTIQTRFMADSVDVFMSDEELLYSLGEFEYLEDLNSCLPAEVLDKYKDDLVVVKCVETGKTRPVGIRIPADNEWLRSSGWYPDGAVMGIQAGAEHEQLAVAFVLEVLGEEVK